ncbi:PilN domain-containing protein [Alkaliphilus pronyensis]|uniref:PilN domain-containing protein n=1 Tax=Alkaliphilus pronyensis TaxID=1482732 RepID=A0A6I0FDN1_9FIRM|nr:PilN domain-containing protein [Alkaliphilus pronyensis]KAB3537366.1 PilN domain-containing protein [Alkaliphilus pronyensis]
MRDFNFFEIYTEKYEKQDFKRLLVIGIVTLIGGLLVIYPLFNFLSITRLNNEVMTMKEVLDSSNTYETINRVEKKKLEVEGLRSALKNLNAVDAEFKNKDTIDNPLIKLIITAIPDGVFFESINIIGNAVQIKGIARSKDEIAALEYNLKGKTSFTEVFIPSINFSDNIYNFTLTFNVKDVNTNEN